MHRWFWSRVYLAECVDGKINGGKKIFGGFDKIPQKNWGDLIKW